MNISTNPLIWSAPGERRVERHPGLRGLPTGSGICLFIGKTAKNVPEKKALDYVFGYVPTFDISTRGLVRRTQFIGKGQGCHGCCGPWIITKDEIPDPHNVVVKSWTNGEPRQNYNTSAMAHKIPNQIAWLTKFVPSTRRLGRDRNVPRRLDADQPRRHDRNRVREHGPGKVQCQR